MISLIVAYDKNRGIGNKGTIPWKIKEDLQNFKKITTGHFVVMGRKTYESIGKALPKRINIVISKNINFKPKDALVFDNLEKSIDFCNNWSSNLKTFIIGGGEIYKQSIQWANSIIVTEIDGEFNADTYFPNIDNNLFQEISKSKKQQENGISFQYIEYSKRKIN